MSVLEVGLFNGVIGGFNWIFFLGYFDVFMMNWVIVDFGFLGMMGLVFKVG